ncbi:Uncharacterised protein [Mycobacteroides abscessus subsp. abscessus]|nr:Uncharacterised protein [Mycobacteroides abscessus subsp. abscessus]
MNSRPYQPLLLAVWNATCVRTTPMAAQARMPSTAGRKLRVPLTSALPAVSCPWSPTTPVCRVPGLVGESHADPHTTLRVCLSKGC